MSYLCSHCNKSFDNVAVDKAFAVAYNECKGKKCPHCGKIRILGVIKMTLFNAGASDTCPKCGKNEIVVEFSSSPSQGTCIECFWEREEKKGCICIYSLCEWGRYYCPLCEEVHTISFKCRECATKKEEMDEVRVSISKRLISPWKVVVPSVVGGVFLGIFFGLILGKMLPFLKKPPN